MPRETEGEKIGRRLIYAACLLVAAGAGLVYAHGDQPPETRDASAFAPKETADTLHVTAKSLPLRRPALAPAAAEPAPTPAPVPTRSPAEPASEELEKAKSEEAAAETALVPPLPLRKPSPPVPVHPRDAEAEPWSEEQIAEALKACDELLGKLPVKFEKLPPLREGICGTPAPVKVEAVGDDPAIAISPGATMSCPMAAALARWISTSVQPAARELLGAPVVRFHSFASYDCRNRYGDPNKPISEHAAANALDLGAFETSSGQRVSVLDYWNAPARVPLPLRAPPKDMVTETEKAAARNAQLHGRVVKVALKSPSRLARPPLADAPTGTVPPKPDKRSVFLRRIHEQACGVFGTVLGPEANQAHANHFHLDMAKRRHSAFCE